MPSFLLAMLPSSCAATLCSVLLPRHSFDPEFAAATVSAVRFATIQPRAPSVVVPDQMPREIHTFRTKLGKTSQPETTRTEHVRALTHCCGRFVFAHPQTARKNSSYGLWSADTADYLDSGS